jgi:hypothetical protein
MYFALHISGLLGQKRRIDMKKFIILSLLLIVICVLSGQAKPAENEPTQPPPFWIKESRKAAESNYLETFADAFKDPNIFIGVFELPELSDKFVPTTTLSSGEILEYLPGYGEAMVRLNLIKLRCVKTIKGKFDEPVIFVRRDFPPVVEAAPRIPAFIPPFGSKWVLALQNTSKEYRISQCGGEEIEKYKFINDRTMFRLFRYGHSTLCLKWPDEDKRWTKPEYLVKAPESIIEDFEAIQRVVPYTQKEKIDPNKVAAIDNIKKALKTNVAKSIFEKVLADRSQKTQDPNDG